MIGVHTPEFWFEHDIDNVRRAASDMRVEYPIAIDNDYAVWQAFSNNYWPALYFVDAEGLIRHHQFGEGDYANSERIIQELLADAGTSGDRAPASVDAHGAEVPADWDSLESPETYVGYARAERFASPVVSRTTSVAAYAIPERLRLNHWALGGDWTVEREAAVLHEAGGRIAFNFHARDLHLILTPRSTRRPVRFRVLIDGEPPGAAHGLDIDDLGNGAVAEPADVPADPTSRSRRGSTLRDRVPRPRRRGVCIYLRMSRGCVWTTSRRSNN